MVFSHFQTFVHNKTGVILLALMTVAIDTISGHWSSNLLSCNNLESPRIKCRKTPSCSSHYDRRIIFFVAMGSQKSVSGFEWWPLNRPNCVLVWSMHPTRKTEGVELYCMYHDISIYYLLKQHCKTLVIYNISFFSF